MTDRSLYWLGWSLRLPVTLPATVLATIWECTGHAWLHRWRCERVRVEQVALGNWRA